jgi:hypothetical protein
MMPERTGLLLCAVSKRGKAIPSLFDPQMVKMLDDRMILHGYPIHVDMETRAIGHYAQAWVLRPVTHE